MTRYSVSYNTNNGTNFANATTTYTTETPTITLGTPTKTGYVFDGWYTNSTLTGTATNNIATGSYGNKTFYAKWSICASGTYWNNGQCTTCPSGTYSPAGSVKASQCGHILHIGDNATDIIYLHADKETTPSLNVSWDGKTWYANMTEDQTKATTGSDRYFKIEYGDKLFYVCDDTMCGDIAH